MAGAVAMRSARGVRRCGTSAAATVISSISTSTWQASSSLHRHASFPAPASSATASFSSPAITVNQAPVRPLSAGGCARKSGRLVASRFEEARAAGQGLRGQDRSECRDGRPGRADASGTEHSTYRTQVRILSLVSTPDAQPVDSGIDWREQRVLPRHAAVWVRHRGRWRKGKISVWAREPGSPYWTCVILADEPPHGSRWLGRFIHDPASIKPRYGDTPPT
jgi:hypothetical protein